MDRCCQSCGMPMGISNEMYGTEKDGSKSKDYCEFCYNDGKFTKDVNMNGLINICIPFMLEANDNLSENEARLIMEEILPTLKRWK